MVNELSIFCAAFTVVLAALLSVIMAKAKGLNAVKVILVAAFVFAAVFQLLLYLRLTGRFNSRSLWYEAHFPFRIGMIPLLFLYVRALSEKNFQLGRVNPAQSLPFFAGCIWCFARFHWQIDLDRPG